MYDGTYTCERQSDEDIIHFVELVGIPWRASPKSPVAISATSTASNSGIDLNMSRKTWSRFPLAVLWELSGTFKEYAHTTHPRTRYPALSNSRTT